MAVRSGVRKSITIALSIALLTLVASEPEFYTHESHAGDYVKRMHVGGHLREFRLHIPTGYDGIRAVPLVFVFHGSSASATVIERETGFDDIADSLGFIVVYPEGLHRGWNIGECCRYSYMENVNEIAFVQGMLNHLEAGLAIDRTRVYSTGYSDGGTLSVLLACTLSNRITAIASVSGTLFTPLPSCTLTRPVPVLIVHGMADSHAGSVAQRLTRVQLGRQHTDGLAATPPSTVAEFTTFISEMKGCVPESFPSITRPPVRLDMESLQQGIKKFYQFTFVSTHHPTHPLLTIHPWPVDGIGQERSKRAVCAMPDEEQRRGGRGG